MTSHLCQSCQSNPATFHFTEIKDGQKDEVHYCEACATAQGLNNEGFVASIVDAMARGSRSKTTACPHCGITFEEFRAKGRFGCPRDYEVFEDALLQLVGKMHAGARRHTGRLPAGSAPQQTETGNRLLQLRTALKQAVQKEDYEDAARLRDEIQTIDLQKGDLQKSDKGPQAAGAPPEGAGGLGEPGLES
jgi:protein arginine kinase activator